MGAPREDAPPCTQPAETLLSSLHCLPQSIGPRQAFAKQLHGIAHVPPTSATSNSSPISGCPYERLFLRVILRAAFSDTRKARITYRASEHYNVPHMCFIAPKPVRIAALGAPSASVKEHYAYVIAARPKRGSGRPAGSLGRIGLSFPVNTRRSRARIFCFFPLGRRSLRPDSQDREFRGLGWELQLDWSAGFQFTGLHVSPAVMHYSKGHKPASNCHTLACMLPMLGRRASQPAGVVATIWLRPHSSRPRWRWPPGAP
jgi:hypothetical protein